MIGFVHFKTQLLVYTETSKKKEAYAIVLFLHTLNTAAAKI